jgi:hypothetical protein
MTQVCSRVLLLPAGLAKQLPCARRLRSPKCAFLVRCTIEFFLMLWLYFVHRFALSKAKMSCFASFVDFSTIYCFAKQILRNKGLEAKP